MRKKGASPQQQQIIDYAYEHTNSLDFIYMLEAENGDYDIQRLSDVVGANGFRDQGLCQLNRKYHIPFILSPPFQDYKAQIRYCWEVWNDAIEKDRLETTFYGIANKEAAAKNFIIK